MPLFDRPGHLATHRDSTAGQKVMPVVAGIAVPAVFLLAALFLGPLQNFLDTPSPLGVRAVRAQTPVGSMTGSHDTTFGAVLNTAPAQH